MDAGDGLRCNFFFNCFNFRYDERHICFDEFACPDEYHGRFPKSLHVLVCETHKTNEENLELLDLCRKEFVSNKYKT